MSKTPPAYRGHALRLLSLGFILLAVFACNQDVTRPNVASAPAGRLAPTGTVSRNESPANVTLSLALNDTNGSGLYTGSYPVYPHPTVVKAAASGGIATYTPNYSQFSPSTVGQGSNTFIAWRDAANNFQQANFGTNPQYVLLSGGVSQVQQVGRGGLNPFSWTGYLGGVWIDCGPAKPTLCLYWTGDAGTITLTRLESSLSFTASSRSVSPGSSVVFSAAPSPALVEGNSIPVEVDSASWTPDPDSLGGSPADTALGCSFNPCTRTMTGPGTMTIVAYVNGKRQTGSIHVNVACGQVSGDSIANSASFRKQMANILVTAGVNNPVSTRIEHGGYIYIDNLTQTITLTDVPSTTQNICEYQRLPYDTIPGKTVLSPWHVHPFIPGVEQMPPNLCPGGHPNSPTCGHLKLPHPLMGSGA